jgi:hypothetical protein
LPKTLASRGRSDPGVDGGHDFHQGVEHFVRDASRSCLLDSAARADLAAPGHRHGETDEVLLAVCEQRSAVRSTQILENHFAFVTHCPVPFSLEFYGFDVEAAGFQSIEKSIEKGRSSSEKELRPFSQSHSPN